MPRTAGYYLPVEPFRARLAEWLARQKADYLVHFEKGMSMKASDKGWMRLPPEDYLLLYIGRSRRWLEKILRGEIATIDFDAADELLCAMNIAHEWRTNPLFSDLYKGADLVGLDMYRPTIPDARTAARDAHRPRTYDYAEALRLHDEEGLSWVQVGQVLEVNPSSLRATMCKIREGEKKAA